MNLALSFLFIQDIFSHSRTIEVNNDDIWSFDRMVYNFDPTLDRFATCWISPTVLLAFWDFFRWEPIQSDAMLVLFIPEVYSSSPEHNFLHILLVDSQ